MKVWSLVLSSLTLALPVTAQAPAYVRAELVAEPPIWVGQRVSLDVILAVPTRFAGVPSFDLPDVDGAFIVRVGGGNSRPTFSSESRDGVTYTAARYRFAVFFQSAGPATIPPIDVRFQSVEGFGEEPEPHAGATNELTATVVSPPGTEHLAVVVSTTRLEVEDTWDRQPSDARVGDAYTRTVTMRAPNVPGLLLPPLPLESAEGLDVHVGEPSVETLAERGAFDGTRISRVTYVCAQEGIATIPPLTLRWWNVESAALESIELEGASFSIAPGPPAPEGVDVATGDDPGDDSGTAMTPVVLVVLAAAVAVALGLRRRSGAWIRAARRRWNASEHGRFRSLRTALARDDSRRSLIALYRWLDVALVGERVATVGSLRERVTDPATRRELDALEGAAVAGTPWNGKALGTQLASLRRNARRARKSAAHGALPPLNPSGR